MKYYLTVNYTNVNISSSYPKITNNCWDVGTADSKEEVYKRAQEELDAFIQEELDWRADSDMYTFEELEVIRDSFITKINDHWNSESNELEEIASLSQDNGYVYHILKVYVQKI